MLEKVLRMMFFAIVFGLGLVCLAFAIADAQAAPVNPPEIDASEYPIQIEVGQYLESWNSKVITVTLVATDTGITPEEWLWLSLGDGASTDIQLGPTGVRTIHHDYAWTPEPVTVTVRVMRWISHTFETVGMTEFLLVPPGTEPTPAPTPEPTRWTINLPLVLKSKPKPICSIEISSQQLNHVVFDVAWQNADPGTHTVRFYENGPEDRQFHGSSGSGTTWTDYPYPGTKFTATMFLDGGGSCSVDVVVDWP
jgi:hypothetical protein